MRKPKRAVAMGENSLDNLLEKRGRGRPFHVLHSEVIGRADNYRSIFGLVWSRLRDPLVNANTVEEVTEAFEKHAEAYAREFVPRLAEDILKVIQERKFPKRSAAQIGFIADSLAGRPNVEPRTSRDICAKERMKQGAKSQHKILCKEFYVECSCGYEGPAKNNACRKCGAEISPLSEMLSGTQFI